MSIFIDQKFEMIIGKRICILDTIYLILNTVLAAKIDSESNDRNYIKND